MRTVSLVNRRKSMLPPLTIPEMGMKQHVIGVNERNGKTGVVGRRKLTRHLPQSVTLCARGTPGDRIDGLPESAATCQSVLAAKARGDIDVLVIDHAPPTPAPDDHSSVKE